MSKIHKVEQGECLSTIAAMYGWADWRKVYEASENEPLRKLRPNPNVLFPGDQVIIPQPQRKPLKLETGKVHTIVVKRPKVSLRIQTTESFDGEALKGTFRLFIDGATVPIEGPINGGLIDVAVPMGSKEAKIILLDDAGAAVDELALLLGHKDPLDTIPGALSRLSLIGIEPADETPEAIEECIRFFQQCFDLPEDGTLNVETQAALEKIGGT